MFRLGMSTALGAVSLLAPLCWSAQAAADNYGAIAFSQDTGAIGFSHDYGTRAGAEERALNECGSDCEVVLWFRNACAALATGDDNGYGTGWASSRREAEQIARSNCNDNAKNCTINRWVCTSR